MMHRRCFVAAGNIDETKFSRLKLKESVVPQHPLSDRGGYSGMRGGISCWY